METEAQQPKRRGRLELPRLRTTAALIAVSAIPLGFATACSTGTNYYATCVDSVTGQVIDPVYCDGRPYNGGFAYIFMPPTRYIYAVGTPRYIPLTSLHGGSGYFRANDQTARANAGLARTGAIKAGTSVSSSKGGFTGARSSGTGSSRASTSHAGGGGHGGGS